MEFITRRTIGNQNVILIEEIIDRIDKKKFELLVKSGNLKAYRIKPAVVMPASRKSFYAGLNSFVGDNSLPTMDEPESLQAVPWVSSMGYDGLYVLVDAAEPFLLSEPVQVEPMAAAGAGPVDVLLKSLRPDVEEIWKAVMHLGKKDKAYHVAVDYLKNHPGAKIMITDLDIDFFLYIGTDKAKRSITSAIYKAVLSRHEHKLSQNKIMEYLKAS